MKQEPLQADFILIGGGIMSATLGTLLKALEPGCSIAVFERLDRLAGESSDAWNNAGTGHAAFCELNYTPEQEDGSVDITKAIKICEQFELSKQLWAWLAEQGSLPEPDSFVHTVPHCSFVMGADDVAYLHQRWENLRQHHFFMQMEYTESRAEMANWFPLVMQGRNDKEPVAATRMALGTDVDFGTLARHLFTHLAQQPGVQIFLNHHVHDIDPVSGEGWEAEIKDAIADKTVYARAPFVFVGAGGGALRLLNKARIDEIDGYGGFPVGGKWLRCTNPAVAAQHQAKVYGKAGIGTPPMSVPHLDTRLINGKKELLFGPYAGFSTRFLKHGSLFDLPASLDFDNMLPMIQAGLHNLPLTKYLIEQVRMSFEEKFEAMLQYYPSANINDWELIEAGQRVQVIKKDAEKGGVLEFGTEVIHTADGSMAGLLGASPGASTAVAIMLDVLQKCFGVQMQSPAWQSKLSQMIPGFGKALRQDAVLTVQLRNHCSKALCLQV